MAADICANVLDADDQIPRLEVREYSIPEAKRALLDIVRKHVVEHDTRSTLAVQIASAMKSKSERQSNQLCAGLRSAGLPLPVIFGSVLKITGLTVGNRPWDCMMSPSPDDPETGSTSSPRGPASSRVRSRRCRRRAGDCSASIRAKDSILPDKPSNATETSG